MSSVHLYLLMILRVDVWGSRFGIRTALCLCDVLNAILSWKHMLQLKSGFRYCVRGFFCGLVKHISGCRDGVFHTFIPNR